MAITAIYHTKLLVRETFANLAQELSGDILARNQMDDVETALTSSTTVPVTTSWCRQRTLTAGADDLDLTALPDTPTNKDFTGLKVQLVKITAATANTAVVKFGDASGGSNKYPLFGASTFYVEVPAGCTVMGVWADKLADVGATAKTIYVASDDVDAIYDIQLVAG